MDDPSYRQLHQIACGSVRVQNRVRMVDTCLKGYIVCVADEGVLLYNLQRYLKVTETCTLRRDKSLPDHPPDILIKVPDPVSWVAFNSEGLVLAVVTSNASQGTFVNLVNLTDLLKCTSVDLTSVARPVRVCGGDSEYEVRDFAWSPTAPAAFVLILKSGEVRLFNASACPTESCTLVSQLQPNVDAQCRVLLYNLQRYLKVTETCTLRRDKSLPDHPPDILIKVPDPVSWVAFNSEGLVLAVVTSNASQGTFVNLVNLTDLLKCTSVDLTSVARPVRVCGGDSEYEVRDFAWSPTAPAAFVLILKSGEVRLFNASACPTESCTLVSQLQPNVDAKCLSWSAKGKQLAVCMQGHLSTSNGVAQGPMIVQMDPTLRLKRVVQLNSVFDRVADGGAVCPTDLLWVSPACFVIGLHLVAPSGQLSLRSLLINAPTKSNEVTYSEIRELRANPEHGGHLQFYFHAVGTSHFLATHSADGEEIILFLLPTTSSAPPQAVLSIELPPGGSPLGICLSFCELKLNSGALSAYLVARLTNGNLSPFVLHKFDKIMSVPATLPEALPLPTPATPQTTTIKQSSLPIAVVTQNQSAVAVTSASLFTTSRTSCIPNRTSSVTSDKTILAVTTVNNVNLESGNTTASDLSTWDRSSTELRSIMSKSVRSNQLSTVPLQAVSPAVAADGGGVVHLPKSIHVASTQFTAALDTEAEASRSAWRDLFELMNHGPQMSSQSSEATGIDVTEAHLHDTELFLSALDKVLCELKNGAKERKQDLSTSVAYAEKVRRTLRLYAGGDWILLLTNQLDPEAARLLSRVKRRARLVESSLFDLDAQLDAILSPNAISSGPLTASNHTSISSSEPANNKSDNLPSSKLLSALETTKRLLCTENGRVKSILESFKRLRLTTSLHGQDGDELESSVRTPSSWYSHRNSTRSVDRSRDETALGNDMNSSPAYQSLLQRDLALYRLFANYKLNTVHAPLVCPVVDQAVGSDDALVELECEVSSPLLTERISVTHPQQMKLDQLVNHSGQAASVNSPPIKSSALPNTEFLNSDRSTRTHPTTSSSTPPRIQVIPATLQQPMANGVKFDAVNSATFTSPISINLEAKTAEANPHISGSFLLGTKAASASFVSPTLQKSLAPSTNLTSPDQNSPVSNARSSFVVETAATAISAPNVPPTFAGITTSTQESSSISLDSQISQASMITTAASTPFPKLTGLMSSATITTSASAASVTSNAPPASTKTSPLSLFSSPSTGNLFGQTHGIPSAASAAVASISFRTLTSVTETTAIATTIPTMGSLFSTPTAATSSVVSISNKPVFSFGALSLGVSSTAAPTTNTNTADTSTTALTTSLFAGGLLGPKQSEPTPATTTIAFSPAALSQTATTTATGFPQVTTVAGIFGAPATSSSLFGGFGMTPSTVTTSQVTTTTTASAGGISSSMSLFGTPATTGFSGGLFGSTFKATSTTTSTTAVAGLFGAITTSPASTLAATTSGTSGGLFQFAQNTTSTSPFGATPTLFGRPTTTQPASSGLFGFTSAASPSTTVSITSTTSTTTVPGGLFGAFSPGQQSSAVAPSGGLFGAPAAAGDQAKDVNSLFCGSSFGLGSTGPVTQGPVQNVFGRPSNTNTGSSLSAGGTVGQGLFGSTKPSTGLFGAPAFAPPTTTTGAGSMSLFGSKPSFTAQAPTGSGLFSAAHPSPPSAGFGSPPVFGDSPLFGGQPAFGFGGSAAFTASAPAAGSVGLFGTGVSPAGGGSLFGSPTAAASASGGGLFAALAAKTDNPSFGSLAMGSPQTAPASPFGASPSFTQRRA